MKIKSARFLVSNSDYKKCPQDDKREFAFIGRSNVGKSSLINSLTGRRSLAKTSGRPGKTQLINHFVINEEWHLVDLPGYGWARVSKTQRAKFEKMITGYLLNRATLVTTFVLIDIRLDPQNIDQEFIQWMGEHGIPFVIIFTKADKLSKQKVNLGMAKWVKVLSQNWEELPEMLATSAVTGQGTVEITEYIESLLE